MTAVWNEKPEQYFWSPDFLSEERVEKTTTKPTFLLLLHVRGDGYTLVKISFQCHNTEEAESAKYPSGIRIHMLGTRQLLQNVSALCLGISLPTGSGRGGRKERKKNPDQVSQVSDHLIACSFAHHFPFSSNLIFQSDCGSQKCS